MKKFNVKFSREFEVEIEAENTQIAEALTHQVMAQFPPDTCKLLSIIAEGVQIETSDKPTPPFGRPNGGGSPGTPVARQEVLVDQIAKAA